jgi:hypothetical protein
LDIFVSDWQGEFLPTFLFLTEKKNKFGWKVFVGPRSSKTFEILVNPKVTYKNFHYIALTAILLGLSILQISITLSQRIS